MVWASQSWRLLGGAAADAPTTVKIDSEDWWRIATLGVQQEEAWKRAHVRGDAELARVALAATAIIA